MHAVDAEVRGHDATSPLLKVRNLTCVLTLGARTLRVVDGVDLEVRRGETLALLGESGCGKSMTALSLMRLLPPSGRIQQGSVCLAGTDLLGLSEPAMRNVRGGRIGMIFQEPQTSLNPVLSVGEQIAEAVRIHAGLSSKQVFAQVLELVRAVGISDPERRIEQYPHQLSGGMKQRVMIAMALAGRPDLLIADEPTTALDVTIQAQVLCLLKELQRDTGMAVLLITHDLGVAAETADRLAIMYAGHIVETATVPELIRDPAHPYTRRLMKSLPALGKRADSLTVIPGRVPPLDRGFEGCRFADRCDCVMELCRNREPEWHSSSPTHRLRCHLWAGQRALVDGGVVRAANKGISSPAGPRETVLQVDDLKIHFPIRRGILRRPSGWVKAVDGVSLDLRDGETLALVGESGCGKTTVGKSILQLIPTSGGTVRLNNAELTRLDNSAMRVHRKDLQMIFQDPSGAMNPRMRVGDIVGEGLRSLGVEPSRRKLGERVRALLEQVGLAPETASRFPHELSGGQRQRVCIARALALEPMVIVCDEPTSALDISVQAQVLNLLKQLQAELRLSYLFITHNISVVSYLAHRVAVMYLGRILERGTAEEVLLDPRHPYTKALLSAVPDLEQDGNREPIRLKGDIPSPSAPPTGCHFHPRCPEARAECARDYPTAIELSATRSVHCIHARG